LVRQRDSGFCDTDADSKTKTKATTNVKKMVNSFIFLLTNDPFFRYTEIGRSSFRASTSNARPMVNSQSSTTQLSMSAAIDMKGKVAFIAGVADSSGYGWAIARALADAGCTIIVGTWPPVLKIFEMGLKKGQFDDDSKLSDGSKMTIEKIYPLDAVFDTPDDVPEEISTNKRYAGLSGFTISEVAKAVEADYGKIDILVHSLANGPEVTKPLLETSRKGYLAASSASAFSAVSLLQKFGPIMNTGGSFISLTYIASEKVIPGYGGGMSSAKAQLESDTRTLSFEAGRKWGLRVNTISAGPLKSRAASAIGKEPGQKTFIELAIDYSKANSPLDQDLYNDDVGNAALFLAGPMARTVTGVTLYVDNGLHAMGMALDSKAMEQ
jgi:enoyl-[acyl-carrier protein] reductase I